MNLNGWNCVINDLPENGTKCMCILNMSSIAEICTFENNRFNRSGVMFWIKLDDLLKNLKDVSILPNVNAGYFLTKDKEDIRVRYYSYGSFEGYVEEWVEIPEFPDGVIDDLMSYRTCRLSYLDKWKINKN